MNNTKEVIKPYSIKGQLYALNKLINQFTSSREERLFVVSELIGCTIYSTRELSIIEWQRIRNLAYPYWETGDWTLRSHLPRNL